MNKLTKKATKYRQEVSVLSLNDVDNAIIRAVKPFG